MLLILSRDYLYCTGKQLQLDPSIEQNLIMFLIAKCALNNRKYVHEKSHVHFTVSEAE